MDAVEPSMAKTEALWLNVIASRYRKPFGVAFAGGGDAVHLQLTGLRLLVYALPLLGIYMNSRDRVVAVHVDGGAGDRGFTCVAGTNLRRG